MDRTGGPKDNHLDGVTSASSAQSSLRQLSPRAGPHPTEIQTTTVPGGVTSGDRVTAERRDTSQHGVELQAQSQTPQVSPRIQVGVVSPRQSLNFFPHTAY
jgi:hypothetical protein